MARFAVELVFTADTEKRLEVRPKHREFLKGLQDRGMLLASGPWASDTGALLIFDIADEDALKHELEHDPYAAADVVSRVRITEWNPVLGSWLAG